MPHLEVIKPHGMIELHNLPSSVIYIGQHPDNNIVIMGIGIDDWHLVLDCRQEPYQATILSHLGNTAIDGQILPSNTPVSLSPSASLQVADYELILLEDTSFGQQAPIPATLPRAVINEPAPEIYSPSPPPVIVRPSPPPSQLAISPHPYNDRPQAGPAWENDIATSRQNGQGDYSNHNDFIVELAGFPDETDRKLQIDAGKEVIFNVTILNTGDRQTDFALNLYMDVPYYINPKVGQILQGDEQTFNITLKPENYPSQPSSRAGEHPITVEVIAKEYRDSVTQFSATLIVNPYYKFAITELNPRKRTISYFKDRGETTVTITNKGNSEANFQLGGHDDEHSCSYEFRDLPNEKIAFAERATLQLPPESGSHFVEGESPQVTHIARIPINIIPHRKHLLSARTHHFMITIKPVEGEQIEQKSLPGELKQRALMPWPILLVLLGLMICACFICSGYYFRPYINTFTVNGAISDAKIEAGETVTLAWDASPFASLRIDPEIGSLETTNGNLTVTPQETTVYKLTAENWLSKILPFLSNPVERRVEVVPIMPKINKFEVSSEAIYNGQEVTLFWEVANADKVILTTNDGPPETITDLVGERQEKPSENTVYGLEVSNYYNTVSDKAEVRVSDAPPPTPNIVRFSANPITINEGEQSNLSWLVQGVNEVEIQGVAGANALPPDYNIAVQPTGSTDYILKVPSVEPRPIRVHVIPATATPTATPQPDAPTIIFFTGDPETLTQGIDSNQVELTWSVEGEVTEVQISSPSLGNPITGLGPADSVNVVVDETTLFVLTASNQDKNTSANIQIQVDEPTPTQTPTSTPTSTETPIPTETPVPTETPYPPPNVAFTLAGPSPEVIEISPGVYQVYVGSTVATLNWIATGVQQAGSVEVSVNGPNGFSEHSTGSSSKVIAAPITSINQGTYNLTALNGAGFATTASLIVNVIERQPTPAPPVNVSGSAATGPINTITWNKSGVGDANITGFSVYRKLKGASSFTNIYTTNNPAISVYPDNPGVGNCEVTYYVVALYLNMAGNDQETPSSSTSWTSPNPC